MKPSDLVVTRWGAQFRGRRLPCAIGHGGMRCTKTEGDGVTPAGNWRIVGALYRADRMPRPDVSSRSGLLINAVGPGHIWSDDPADPAYNHLLHAPRHPFSHERLARGDPLYDLVLITNYNWPTAIANAGSAIFVHQWRKPRHPTEGCVAFSASDLRWILKHWTQASRLILRG